MKTLNKVLQYLLGLILLLYALNKFFQFMPVPEMRREAVSFYSSLVNTGYIMPVVAVFEILVALALFSGRYIALAMAVLFPLSLNFVFFHLFLDLPNITPALLTLGLNVYFLFRYRRAYHELLLPR